MLKQAPNSVTIITPPRGWLRLNLPELWRFRELFYIFSWRDFKVRYKQTVIGVLWAILQPFLLMLVFSFFFGKLVNVGSNGVPYPIFVYAGLLFWTYFSTAITSSSNSLIENENIVKKIYFPRLILPLSATITPLVDFLLAFVVLGGIMVFYRFTPSLWAIIFIPLLMIMSFMAASGLGALLASINVRFRDVRYALPFVIQTLFFVTPVIYPSSLVPDHYRLLLSLNPMSGIINTARSILLHQGVIPYGELATSFTVIVVIFAFGLFFFRRTERVFADIA